MLIEYCYKNNTLNSVDMHNAIWKIIKQKHSIAKNKIFTQKKTIPAKTTVNVKNLKLKDCVRIRTANGLIDNESCH